MMKMQAAIASGSQPPLVIFSAFDARNAASIRPSAPNSAIAQRQLQPHWRVETIAARNVLIAITPVTAIPYAAASASELRKMRTMSTTPTASTRFVRGT